MTHDETYYEDDQTAEKNEIHLPPLTDSTIPPTPRLP